MTRPLNKARFIAWLKSKPADKVVGWCRNTRSCPLATFLREEGYQYAFVHYHLYQAVYDESRTTPRWARRFVHAVDQRPHAKEYVTAAEALAYTKLKVKEDV